MHSVFNNQHISAIEGKVTTDNHVEDIAHAALKNVPGGTEFVKQYFSKESYDYQQLPRRAFVDYVHHPPFGQTY